jgi:mxaK protein
MVHGPLKGRRVLVRAALALLAIVAMAAVVDLVQWWRAERLAQQIATLADDAAPDAGEAPLLRLARAARAAERGDTDAAINLYRSLHGDAQAGTIARYNGSNLLMREAMRLRGAGMAGQAVTLIELAKQGYRDLLRADPGHWEARYNLERAQRLVPEPEDVDPSIAEPRNDAERAATTMRGVSPGLP